MTTFPTDTDDAADKIAKAPDSVKARYRTLQAEKRESDAERSARHEEINEINEQIQDETRRLHLARREEEKGGAYRTETTETDPKTGAEITTRKLTGYVEKIKAKLKSLVAERRELLEKKSKRADIQSVNDDLGGGATRPLVPAEPITWTPNEGETITDGYKREFATLSVLQKNEQELWNAPRTLAETEKTACAEIDRTAASGALGFGGHRRGSSIGHRGLQVATSPQIAWPTTRPGIDAMEVPDAPALVAWLLRDQLKAAAINHIRTTFTDEGAISAADKPAMLVEVAKRVWHQRRIVEAAYLVCSATGVRNLNRPRSTPTEILLDILPWRKGIAVASAATPMAAPDLDAGADDLDFEGDAGRDE